MIEVAREGNEDFFKRNSDGNVQDLNSYSISRDLRMFSHTFDFRYTDILHFLYSIKRMSSSNTSSISLAKI